MYLFWSAPETIQSFIKFRFYNVSKVFRLDYQTWIFVSNKMLRYIFTLSKLVFFNPQEFAYLKNHKKKINNHYSLDHRFGCCAADKSDYRSESYL